MMRFDILTRPGAADAMRRILKPAAILYLVLALWFGGRAVLLNKAAAEAGASAKGDSAALGELRKKLSAAKKPEAPKGARNNGAVAALQSLVEKQSRALGCSVAEFQASSETQPYLSHFEKDTPPGSWMQVEVLFSVKGRLPDVYKALTAMSAQQVPFEPNSVELVRDGVAANGAVTVVARVQGRVLTRGGEVKQ